jgi:hypothetical protein
MGMSEKYGEKDTHNPIIAIEMIDEKWLAKPDGPETAAVEVGHTKQDCLNWMKGKTGSFLFARRVCRLKGEEVTMIKVSEI